MGKIKLFPTAEYSSKQPSDPVVPLGTMYRYLPRPQQVRQNRGADQHDSGAIPRSLRENLYLQSFDWDRRRLDPRQEVHRGGPGG